MINGNYKNRRLDALTEAELLPFKMGEDVVKGQLLWIDPTDLKVYQADPTDDKPAMFLLAEEQIEPIGLAFTDNRIGKCYEGTLVNPVLHYLFNSTPRFTNVQVAGRAPVYLAADGQFTLTEPTTIGEILQIVGHVVGIHDILIDLSVITFETIS